MSCARILVGKERRVKKRAWSETIEREESREKGDGGCTEFLRGWRRESVWDQVLFARVQMWHFGGAREGP